MPKVPQLVSIKVGAPIRDCLIPKPQFFSVGHEDPGWGAMTMKEAGRQLFWEPPKRLRDRNMSVSH